MLYHDHIFQQQQSCPPVISHPQRSLVDRHYSSPASYNEPIQPTQYQQGYQYSTKTFSGANLWPSLPPASAVAQSIGRNSQSSESLVVAPQYPIVIVSSQSQPSAPQSKRQQYSNTGHSSSFRPHSPKLSYPNLTQQSSCQHPVHNPQLQSNFTEPMNTQTMSHWPAGTPFVQIPPVKQLDSLPQSRRQQYSNTGHSSSFPPRFPNLTQQSSCQHPVHNPQLQSNFTEPMNTQTMSHWPAGPPFVQIPPVKQLDSLPQSRRQHYSNTGHSNSFPPHSPKLSYPNLTQESSTRVLPQYNLMSPPQVPEVTYYPDLQAPPQPEQLGDLKPHEFVQPSRPNLPVHLSDHSSHSPEHMSTYSDNRTIQYDTEAVMQGNDENTYNR